MPWMVVGLDYSNTLYDMVMLIEIVVHYRRR